MKKYVSITAMLLSLVGCKEKVEDPYATWMDKWTGPEGAYMEISAGEGSYNVVIANLDGPQTFEGRATPDGIAFEREGKTELIKAGTGIDTGVKWLAEKQDCLIVNRGEGFCRDMQRYNGMGEPGDGMDLPDDMK